MSRARDLSKLGNINALAVDTTDTEVGIASTVPSSTLDVRGELRIGTAIQAGVAGVLTATSFSGSGSNLTGLATTETVRTDTLTVAGVSTLTGVTNVTGAANFASAVNVDATTDSTSATTGALIVDGGLGVAKNVYIGAGLSVAGTLTYEDVTSVDSVGLITAKSGVNVSGGQLAVGVAYSVGAAGVATAAGFVGGTISGTTGTFSGAVSGSTGSFTGDVDIADKIVHTGDTNTAIRFPSADTITAETGGSERVRITSDGDLGVGDNSPDARLHVTETIDVAYTVDTVTSEANNLVKLENPSTTANAFSGMQFRVGSGADMFVGAIQQSANAGDLYVVNQNAPNKELLRIKSTSKVGLGTNNPQLNLHIHSESSNASFTHFTNTTTGVSASDGVSIGLDSDENAVIYNYESTAIRFATAGSERLRIDSSGRLLIGQTSADADLGSQLQVAGSSYAASGILQARLTADQYGPALDLLKSRNTSWGSHTIVQSGDQLGRIYFRGDDGSDYGNAGAAIFGEVDGTPGSDDMPGRLTFYTSADGSVSLTERLRIDSSGFIGAGTASPRRHLHVHNSASATVGFQMTNGATGESNDSQGFQFKVASDLHAEIAQMENSYLSIFTNASEKLRITGDGQLLVGTTSTSGISAGSDDIIIGSIGDSTVRGITFATTGEAAIRWADAGDNAMGRVQYSNSTDVMTLHTANATALTISSSQNATFAKNVTMGSVLTVTGTEGVSANLYLIADDGDDNGDGWRINSNQDDNDLTFANNTSGSYVDKFSINADGVLYNTCKSNGSCNLTLRKTSASDNIDFFQCRSDNNTLRMVINHDGNVKNQNNSYGSTSDEKLKENIVDANSQWADIKAIKVRNFNFKDDSAKTKLLGVVAQEIETVSAGLVSESIDRDPSTGEDLGTKTKSVKYSILYMKAIKALQEAITKIETLETKVAALESS